MMQIHNLKWQFALVCSIMSLVLHGQQDAYWLRLGLGLGNAYSEEGVVGENAQLSDRNLEVSSDFLTYQAYAEAFLSKAWSLGTKVHSMPGSTDLRDVQLYTAYYLDNSYLLPDRSFLSLFLQAGGAYDINQEAYFIPLGAGLKFRISNRVNLNLQMQYRYFPEELPGAEEPAYELVKYYSGVTLSYSFGRHKESFIAPALYVGARAAGPAAPAPGPVEPQPGEVQENPLENRPPPISVDLETGSVVSEEETGNELLDTASFMGKKLRSPTLLKADSLMARLKPLAPAADTPLAAAESTTAPATPRSGRDSLAAYRDSVLRYMRFEAEKMELQNHINRLKRQDTFIHQQPPQQVTPTTTEGQSNTPGESMQLMEQRMEYLEQRNRELQNQLDTREDEPATVESAPRRETQEIREGSVEEAEMTPGQEALLAEQRGRLRRVEEQLDEVLQRLSDKSLSVRDTSFVFSSSRDTVIRAGDTSLANVTRGLNREMMKMQQELSRLRLQLDSAGKARQAERQKVPEETTAPLTTHMVFFTTNSTYLPAQGRHGLHQVISHAESNPQARYRIIGFTDKTGSAEYNRVLSEKRANAVKDFLAQNGISETRMEIESRGVDESLEERSAQYGRRVEVRLITGS